MKLSEFLALKHAMVIERLDKQGNARFSARSVTAADNYAEVHGATRHEAMRALAVKLGWRGKSRCPLPEVGKWAWEDGMHGASACCHGCYVLAASACEWGDSWKVSCMGESVAHESYISADGMAGLRRSAERAARRHWFATHKGKGAHA